MLKQKIGILVAAMLLLWSCNSGKVGTSNDQIVTNIDLVNVVDDKVTVEVDPGKFQTETATFNIPKTVPGTYSDDNYGQYIENFKAFDYKGNELSVTKQGMNSWLIGNAKKLDKVSYQVNDTYDTESQMQEAVFSPSGSNILKDENFMLNLHAFVGYFSGSEQKPYQIQIKYPKNLQGVTSLPKTISEQETYNLDTFGATRYAEVTDNPIMYATPDIASFMVGDMKISLSVYSPNKVYTAAQLKDNVEKMIRAQKRFLGDINATKQYNILLYLSSMEETDAGGFGALEHNTSTVVVLPEQMSEDALAKAMTDVVSHEFFHIVTPLTIHAEEIHYFDYNDPKMSKHLWMYEGVTEYFANLFQVQQDLIDNEDFYDRMSGKINNSRSRFDDTMSFTVMSANILDDPYKDNYTNVYEKGALIGMIIDIQLRESSNGKEGILDLMKRLSNEYGSEKPFKDDELFDKITAYTNPEIRNLIDTYIVGTTPIPYNDYLAKVGLELGEKQMPSGYLLNGQTPYISVKRDTKEIYLLEEGELNTFLTDIGLKNGDIISAVNGTTYNLDNVYDLLRGSFQWKVGDDISFVIKRNGETITIKGKVTEPKATAFGIKEMDLPENSPKIELRKAWLNK